MKIVYTDFAKTSLNRHLLFLVEQGVSVEKALEIQDRIFAKANLLLKNQYLGQVEEYISDKKHRRLIEGNYKIIYRIDRQTIYITDVFDARQDPDKLNEPFNEEK
jgi:plasmid stabilization system protein ParE